jgi:L-asparaginase
VNEKQRVHVITTGGTIAGKPQAGGDVAPGLTGDELLARIPEIASVVEISVESPLNVASAAVGFPEMLLIAKRAQAALEDASIAGVVVTHGTGSLEQTAYFADVTLTTDRPVVFTGAMRNPTIPSDDGPMNLIDAIRVAASPKATGLGVLVVLNGMIHAAKDVLKTHSSRFDAFQSPEFGPLGAIDEDHVLVARRPFRRITAAMPDSITARVEHIPFGADPSNLFLETAVRARVDGLVVEFGRLSPAQLEMVTDALERGIVVVMANPYSTGRLHRNTYRHIGGESHLLGLGVIFAGTPAHKARVKLTALLSAKLSPSQIREAFHAEWD